MNPKSYTAALLSAVTALSLTYDAGAAFGVTYRTTTSDAVDTLNFRLKNPDNTNAELTDPMMFVIDGNGDGLKFVNTGLTQFHFTYTGVFGTDMANIAAVLLGPDDYLLGATTVGAGSVLAGRTVQTFTGIPSQYQTGGTGANDLGGTVRPAYALLFADAFLGDGTTFSFDLTAANGAIPQVGNVNLRIGQNLVSSGYELVPVPEPAAASSLVALGLCGLVMRRRRAR